jgi:ElaB/YqjD/DUF883 family membrane-anchored ribosome-binding protein
MPSHRTNGDISEVSDTVRHAATKLSDDLARTARDAREAADQLGAALRHSASTVASNVADKARARASETTRDMQEGVREHPIAWLGAAVGAGALLTLLLTGRSRAR